jgi:hypothetical protein
MSGNYEFPTGDAGRCNPAGMNLDSQIQSSRPVSISKSLLFVQELADGKLGRQA